jgi:hypothetical protein
MFATDIRGLGLDHARYDRRTIGVIGLVRWAASRGRQVLCGFRGHEMVRHFEPARLSLRCLACGAETPGWTIDVRPAFRRRAPAPAKVHRLAAGDPRPPRSSSSRSDPRLHTPWRHDGEESARAANNSRRVKWIPVTIATSQPRDDAPIGPICAQRIVIGVTPLGNQQFDEIGRVTAATRETNASETRTHNPVNAD